MKDILIIGVFALVLSSCQKDDFSDIQSIRPNNLMFGQQCLNDVDHSPRKASPYQNLTFSDGFDPGQSGECYTMKPRCKQHLDWGVGSECPFDAKSSRYAGLKDLNKCVWKVWNGYAGETTHKLMAYGADAIEVRDGKLILKVLSNPDYDPKKTKCGEKIADSSGGLNPLSSNCKLISGAVDSNYYDEKTKGYNALYGRIEMKARYNTTTSTAAYPALWMWPGSIGKGYPKVATGSDLIDHVGGWKEPRQIGEIDILETDGTDSRDYAFQSYHQWENTKNIHAYWNQGRTLHMSDYHTYGVEWNPGSIKFYLDDCYTYEIKKGSGSTRGNIGIPMTVSDTASYMMMYIREGNNPTDLNSRDTFEIDEVKIYE